jgi:O-antigen/teichoic acid export membrane protein
MGLKSGEQFRDETILDEFIRGFRRDFFIYLPAKLIPAAVGIAGVAIVTRLFSPEAYGQYALVLATGGILIVILSSWINQATLRLYPEMKVQGRSDELIGIVLMFSVLLGGGALLVVTLTSYGLWSRWVEYRLFYLWGGLWVISKMLYNNVLTLFRTDLRAKRYMCYEVAYALLGLGLGLGYVFFISWDIIGRIVGLATTAGLLTFLMSRELHLLQHVRQGIDRQLVRRFLAYGVPLVGWYLGMQLLNVSDRFIIQWFRGSAEVGIYASNYYLAEGGYLVFTPILVAAGPLIMTAWAHHGPLQTSGLISAISRYFLIIAIPLVVGAAVLSVELAALLLGAEYREGHVVIPLVLAGVAAWNFALYGQKGLQLAEKTKVILMGVALCTAVNVGLNLAFVPRYGYLGAAATTLASYLLYLLFAYHASKPYLRWEIPWRTLGRALGASVLMGLYLAALTKLWSMAPALEVLGIALAPLVYTGLLYRWGEIDRHKIEQLFSALKKKR